MCLTPDTCIVNIAKNRHVLEKISSDRWIYLSKEKKKKFRDSIRKRYSLKEDELVYVTTGKNHFYKFGFTLGHTINISAMWPRVSWALPRGVRNLPVTVASAAAQAIHSP